MSMKYFPVLALLAMMSIARGETATAAAADQPAGGGAELRAQCTREAMSFGFDPEPRCREALGIAKLVEAERKAWVRRLLGAVDRWTETCVAAYPGWAEAAGYRTSDRWGQFEMLRGCRWAFAEAPLAASDIAREAWMRQELRSLARSQAADARRAPGTGGPPGTPARAPKLVSAPDLGAYYPAAERAAGVTGRTVAACALDAAGAAHDCAIAETSGNAALDAATLRAIAEMRWEEAPGGAPASRPVRVPISWKLDQSAPRLVSAPDLAKYYPKSAGKAGITGRAVARCILDAGGVAHKCVVVESSGNAALDDATLKVIGDMRWEPAAGAGKQPGRPIRVPIRWTLEG